MRFLRTSPQPEKESARGVLPTVAALVAHLAVAALRLRTPPAPTPDATARTSPEEAENLFVEVDDFPERASPVTAAHREQAATEKPTSAPGMQIPPVVFSMDMLRIQGWPRRHRRKRPTRLPHARARHDVL